MAYNQNEPSQILNIQDWFLYIYVEHKLNSELITKLDYILIFLSNKLELIKSYLINLFFLHTSLSLSMTGRLGAILVFPERCTALHFYKFLLEGYATRPQS